MNTNGTDKVSVDCGKCQQRFSVTLPTVHVMNQPTVSVAVATHEKPIRCPKCGTYYILGGRFVVDWSMMPISDEDAAKITGTNIIVPELGLGMLH